MNDSDHLPDIRGYVKIRDTLSKALRTSILPTFLCPYESLYIDDCINVDWGKENRNLNLCEKWKNLSKSFPSHSLILFTDGSGSREGRKGIVTFNQPYLIFSRLQIYSHLLY